MKKILFISPNASRTGAPILLLNLLIFFKQKGLSFELLLENNGPLLDEYKDVCKTYVFNYYLPGKGRISRLFFRILNSVNRLILKIRLAQTNYSAIYANTAIVNKLFSYFFDKKKVKVINHVHELKTQLRLHAPESLLNQSNLIISVSDEVSCFLQSFYKIDKGLIKTIYGAPKFSNQKNTLSEVHQRWISGSFIVGGAGLADLRKGIDLFIQLCRITNKKTTEAVKFIWIGNNQEAFFNYLYAYYWDDIEKMNIKDKILFTGSIPNPEAYFSRMDVFCLTSREDPYPLVCLEAAMLAVPLISFDKGTGIKEFIDEDNGFVVPYLDIEEMANKIIFLKNNPDIRIKMGEAAKKKIMKENQFDIMAENIYELIKNVI